MEDHEAAHTVLGILGNIASCLFFLSSAPTVVRIVRRKSSDGLSGDLYLFTLFNCLLWCLYGLPFVHPHDVWIVITNCFGSAFSLVYILIYFLYTTTKEKICLLWKLGGVVSSFAILIVLVFLLGHSRNQRILVVGIVCTIVSSAMHITLLSHCRQALRQKEKEFLHPNASVGGFIKGAIWSGYGFVNFDIFILIPNGVGVLVGVIQAILMLCMVRSLGSTLNSSNNLESESSQQTNVETNKQHHDQEKLESAKTSISILSNVSRAPSIIALSRQGSIARNVVVPITVDSEFVELDIE